MSGVIFPTSDGHANACSCLNLAFTLATIGYRPMCDLYAAK